MEVKPKKPRTLKENQKLQSDLFRDLCYGTTRQKFWHYVGTHPRLFENVDIDSATIQYIIDYFYDYNIDPSNFERHFIAKLKKVSAIYNNIKAIEFNKKVFDITTNESVRNIVNDATNELTRDGTLSSIRNDTGTIRNQGSVNETGRNTASETTESDSQGNSKQAARALPMQSTGAGYESLFDWGKGASNINENEDNGSSIEDRDFTENTNRDTTTNYTQTLGTQIEKNDLNKIEELAKSNSTNKDKYKAVNRQAVILIKNIWNYLIEPKSIDYLVSELEPCFSLVL